MNLFRREFLQLAADAATLPTVPRLAWGQGYPLTPERVKAALNAV